MAYIFISHSSKDNDKTLEVADVIKEQISNIFLDFDASDGIKGGEEWEKEIYLKLKKSRIVILVLSPNWFDSEWCNKEYCIARVLKKKIIPIVIQKDNRVTTWDGKDIQFIDFTQDTYGLDKLLDEISKLTRYNIAKLYKPHEIESPFPGLRSFNKNEASLFYGRNEEILEVSDILKRLDEKKLLNILGASGVGKSSFMKAGLIPYIELLHSDEWYILPVFRAKQEILKNFTKLLQDTKLTKLPFKEIFQKLKSSEFKELLDDIESSLYDTSEKINNLKILLPIDQAEEILTSQNQDEKEIFYKILQYLCTKSNFYIIWTLRSDYLVEYQNESQLEFLKQNEETYLLNPISQSNLQEIIQEPALTVNVNISDKIVEQIRENIDFTIPLPLLAYLLQTLYNSALLHKKATQEQIEKQKIIFITIESYKALSSGNKNPIENIINQKAQEVYESIKEKDLVKKLFLNYLISYKDEKTTKLNQKLSNIPKEFHSIIDKFATSRLLIKDGQESSTTVEITHEALINSWDTLQTWIENEKDFLKLKNYIDRAYKEWQNENRAKTMLLEEPKLTEALKNLEKLPQELKDFVIESDRYKKAKRRKKVLIVGSVFLVLLLFGLFSLVQWQKAEEQKEIAKREQLKAKEQTKIAKEQLQKANHNIGLVLVEKAKSAIKKYKIAEANLFAYSALKKLNDKLDKSNAKAEAVGITQSYPVIKAILNINTKNGLLSIAYSPDGKHIVSGSDDKTIRIWDVKSGKLLSTLSGHKYSVTSVAYSPDGKHIISGSLDKTIKIWDAKSGKLLSTLPDHKDGVASVAYSPDGKHIISGSYNGTIKIWDAKSGKLLSTLSGHKDYVTSVAYSPDGKHIISGSRDETIKIWDAKSGKLLHTFSGHNGWVNSVVCSPDGKHIISGLYNGTIKIWDAKSGKLLSTLSGHKDYVASVAYSPDGKHIISGSLDKTIKIWDAKSRKLFSTLLGHEGGVISVAYSPDGKHIVSGSWDKTIKIWDAKNGKLLSTLTGHKESITGLAYLPNGKHIITSSLDGTIKIWDTKSGKLLTTLFGHGSSVFSVAYSPDGKHIISGLYNGTIKIWDAKSGKLLSTLSGHKDYVASVAYSPDGKHIISGSPDKTIKIWDAKSGKLLSTLPDHKDGVASVAYSPDGKHIISGSYNGTIKIWDAKSGKLLSTLSGHKGSVNSVAYSPDRKHIVSGSSDGTIRIWDVSEKDIDKEIKDLEYTLQAELDGIVLKPKVIEKRGVSDRK